jgi:hypothetical protein
MKKIREVLRLRHDKGASIRQIAASCKVSVSTVSEYLYRADAAGFRWPLPEGLTDEELDRALFPPPIKPSEPPRPLPDWAKIRGELSRMGVTLLLIWREHRRDTRTATAMCASPDCSPSGKRDPNYECSSITKREKNCSWTLPA